MLGFAGNQVPESERLSGREERAQLRKESDDYFRQMWKDTLNLTSDEALDAYAEFERDRRH